MVTLNLKKLRQRKNWSLREAAKKFGIPISTYRGWESGRKIPTDALLKISRVHGVSISELLGSAEMKSENVTKAIYYLEEAIELLKTAGLNEK